MQAARECAKGVRWKTSVASWVHPCNLASNCLKLLDELETGEYRLSPYSVFRITSPKPRVIMARSSGTASSRGLPAIWACMTISRVTTYMTTAPASGRRAQPSP